MTDADPKTAGSARPHALLGGSEWRGDDHRLAVAAASEVGLRPNEVALELFTAGFRQGLTLDDPDDHAIVFRGRSVLKAPELKRALRSLLRFLEIGAEAVHVRVHDGQFEIRVAAREAERARPGRSAAWRTVWIWAGFGMLGLILRPVSASLVPIAWGVGLLVGAWQLRRGLVSARAMLAGRFVVGLAMLAQEEKLILPPSSAGQGGSPGPESDGPAR